LSASGGLSKKTIYGWTLQAISEMQITFKDKARANEKAEHTLRVCEHFEEVRNTVIER